MGIRVVLGTPTAAAPKWLMDRYPESYSENVFGIRRHFGGRGHCCVNRTYREYSVKIVRKMAKHYGRNLNVIAWQLNNKIGGTCYCNSRRQGFSQWLQRKYGMIEALNKAWGTVFWSQTYRDFDEVDQSLNNVCAGFYEGYQTGMETSGAPFSHS